MKYLLIITLLFASISGYAQDLPIGTTEQDNLPRDPKAELRSLSGSLKELHGEVHQRSGIIEKRLTSGTDKTKDKLAAQRDELRQASIELQSALERVNAADPADWETIKTETEEVIEQVTEILARTKDTSTSAVN